MMLRTATPRFRAPLLRAALALAAVGGLAACGDDDDPLAPGDVEIESVRLTITPAGGSPTVYTVTANSQNAAPITIRLGTSTIVAEPIGEDGQVSDEADEFELHMEDLPAGVTFTRNGTLASTLLATTAAATPTTVRAVMWHVPEQHDDYTANFRVIVAP